jgi:hypothetical protein
MRSAEAPEELRDELGIKLAESSAEFKRAKYQLQVSRKRMLAHTEAIALTSVLFSQMALGTTNATEVEVWGVENPHLNVQFEKRCDGLLTVTSWIDISTMGSENRLERVLTHGFKLPRTGIGLDFIADSISTGRQAGPHRYLMVRVGVGRPFVSQENIQILPHGYDSVLLNPSRVFQEDGVASFQYEGGSPHTYVVQESAQVLPVCIVNFKQEFGRNDKQQVDERVEDRYDFYDPVLQKPVSNQDRLSGSHSSGEAATHKLLDIGKAYKEAVYASHEADTQLTARRAEQEREVLLLQGKAVGLGENAAEVEERLYTTMQHALFELQDVTQTKMALLLNEQMELSRQMQEIDWMEAAVKEHTKEHERNGDPAALVAGWSSLSALDLELANKRQQARDMQTAELEKMMPELVVRGNLSVVIEDETATSTPVKPALFDMTQAALAPVRAAEPPAVAPRTFVDPASGVQVEL